MGRWWEEMRPIKDQHEVRYVRIESAFGKGLSVRLQRHTDEGIRMDTLPELFDHVSVRMYGRDNMDLNAVLMTVDEWGDCGPPCKYADVFAIEPAEMNELEENVIPHRVVAETKWYSVVESKWGDEKLLEVYDKKNRRVYRIWDNGSMVSETYECKECDAEQEERGTGEENERRGHK